MRNLKNCFTDFIRFKIKALEEMILQRIKKYNDDVAEYDSNIKMTNEKIAQLKQTYEEIQGRYNVRQSDIDKYNDEQRILAVKRAFEQEQCRKATRIQVGCVCFLVVFYYNTY